MTDSLAERQGMNPEGSNSEAGSDDAMPTQEEAAFSRGVGQRLRSIRRAQGLSLADVEARSGGRWSASAIGAYERGFRNLSVPRLKALADFFGVPASVLLGEPSALENPRGRGLVFDLEALRRAMPDSPVTRFADAIMRQRGDFNGRVLSVRRDDLQAVCAMLDADAAAAMAKLRSMDVLVEPDDETSRRRASQSAQGL